MDSSPKLVVIGCTNQDLNIYPTYQTESLGGGGYFSALGASLVLQPIGLTTKVGDDIDLHFLKKQVLDRGIHIIKNHNTTKSIQTYRDETDLSQREISLIPGVSFDLHVEDIDGIWDIAPQIIHIAAFEPTLQFHFIKFIRQKFPNTKISFDTDSWFFDRPELVEAIVQNIQLADIVFLNRVEAKKFHSNINTLPHVVIKQDKDGALVLQQGQQIAATSVPPTTVVDATGAGDILAGAYLGCRINGEHPQSALDTACALATKSVVHAGIEHLFERK